MGQLMMTAEYIIDTCAILSQKPNENFKRKLYQSGWTFIDTCMRDGKVVTCTEIEEEIKDDDIREWIHKQNCTIIEIDEEIEENVRKIVTETPQMIDFSGGGKGSSSGDAFLIATAMSYNLSIITEEKSRKKYGIPSICEKYGIKVYSLIDFWEKEGLIF